SLEPPVVKMLLVKLGSAIQSTAVEPVVLEADGQLAGDTWWHTRSQSSVGPTGGAAFADTAFPSSSNAPVSCTACAPAANSKAAPPPTHAAIHLPFISASPCRLPRTRRDARLTRTQRQNACCVRTRCQSLYSVGPTPALAASCRSPSQ